MENMTVVETSGLSKRYVGVLKLGRPRQLHERRPGNGVLAVDSVEMSVDRPV